MKKVEICKTCRFWEKSKFRIDEDLLKGYGYCNHELVISGNRIIKPFILMILREGNSAVLKFRFNERFGCIEWEANLETPS